MEGSERELAAARLPPSAATRARFAVATSQAASRARLRLSSRTSGHVQERGADQPAGPPVVGPGEEEGGNGGPKVTSTEQQDVAAPQPEPEPQLVAADSSCRPAEGFRGCTIYDTSPERPPGLQVRHDGKRDGETPTEDPSGMPQPVALSAAVQDCGLNADRNSCQTQSGVRPVRPRDRAALAPGAEQQRAAGGNHDDSSDAQPALETVDPAGKANTG